MATGVLVVMVGEATKLGPYLTAADKHYDAEVTFGVATDSGDAEGVVLDERALSSAWIAGATARLRTALRDETRRMEQVPPALSAIKVAGKSAHARVRAGETLVVPSKDRSSSEPKESVGARSSASRPAQKRNQTRKSNEVTTLGAITAPRGTTLRDLEQGTSGGLIGDRPAADESAVADNPAKSQLPAAKPAPKSTPRPS
ncbi:MAG: hypothetical protein AAGN82_31530, partial [Myxococcota bacterium]